MLHARHRLVAMACVAAWLLTACGPGVTPVTPGPTTTPYPSVPPTARPSATPSPTATPFPSPTALAYLDDLTAILAATSGVDGARIAYDAGFEGSTAAPDGTLMTGTGEFTTGEAPRSRVEMDLSAAGLGTMEVIQDGVIVYMRGESFKRLDPKGRWIRVDTTSRHPNAAAFTGVLSQQTDPWVALNFCLGATAPPEVLAPEILDGEPVRRIRLQLDFDTALARAPVAARDYLLIATEALRGKGVAPAFQADVWVDDADRIRRISYRFDLGPTLGGGQMVMSYNLSDFGLDVQVKIPAAKDVVDIETLDLTP